MNASLLLVPVVALGAGLLSGCSSGEKPAAPGGTGSAVAAKPFGQTADGKAVTLFTLKNAGGMTLEIMNYGCIVTRLTAPDRDGKMADVVLGYNTLAEYIKDSPYFGAIVGRYGNRIAHGKFTLDGKEYTLFCNNSPGDIPCALHGGKAGFDKVVWDAEPFTEKGVQGVKMHYLSKDGEEGYPGNLDVTIWHRLTDNNEYRLDYELKSDKATPANVTHHGYFNLRGEGNGDILGHQLTILADKTTPVDKGLIPTGALKPVAGTPFDFTTPHAIGERVNADDEQMKFGGGYDHNWVLNNQAGTLAKAVEVFEPDSGREMVIETTEPGVQFYCGNFLDGKNVGKSGKPYQFRTGFCLETQHYPDSPNHPEFPSTIIKPGQTYTSTTIHRFSTRK